MRLAASLPSDLELNAALPTVAPPAGDAASSNGGAVDVTVTAGVRCSAANVALLAGDAVAAEACAATVTFGAKKDARAAFSDAALPADFCAASKAFLCAFAAVAFGVSKEPFLRPIARLPLRAARVSGVAGWLSSPRLASTNTYHKRPHKRLRI